MNRLRHTLACSAFFFLLSSPQCHAVLIFLFTDDGSDLTVTVSGSINPAGLGAAVGPYTPTLEHSPISSYDVGVSDTTEIALRFTLSSDPEYNPFSNLISGSTPSSGSGDLVAIVDQVNNYLWVPQGYTYGTSLAATAVYTGLTVAGIGVTEGLWATLPSGDTISISTTAIP